MRLRRMKRVQVPSSGAMSPLLHHLRRPAPVQCKGVMLLGLLLLRKEYFRRPTYQVVHHHPLPSSRMESPSQRPFSLQTIRGRLVSVAALVSSSSYASTQSTTVARAENLCVGRAVLERRLCGEARAPLSSASAILASWQPPRRSSNLESARCRAPSFGRAQLAACHQARECLR